MAMLRQSVIVELSATTMRIGEQIMPEEIAALDRRISRLRNYVLILALLWAGTTAVWLMKTSPYVARAAQPESLTVKRLAVVDEKGTERVVISAPLPEPMINGKREKRDSPVSGMLIYDCLLYTLSCRIDCQSGQRIRAGFEGGELPERRHVGTGSGHGSVQGEDVYKRQKQDLNIDSIAVLPISANDSDTNSQLLGDGIADSLIDSLSQLPNLRVMSRSSVFHYRGKDIDPKVVGRELNVKAVLTGRLVRQGDTIDISAELVNASDDSHIWGMQYSRRVTDILPLQQELAQGVSDKLMPQLSNQARKKLSKQGTADPEAYRFYLKGLSYQDTLTAVSYTHLLISVIQPTKVTITVSAPPDQILCARTIASPATNVIAPRTNIIDGSRRIAVTDSKVDCLRVIMDSATRIQYSPISLLRKSVRGNICLLYTSRCV